MRDASRHVSPCGGALGGDKIADVVERHDGALIGALRIPRDAHVEDALAPVAVDLRLAVMQAQTSGASLDQNRRKTRQHILKLKPDQAVGPIGRRQEPVRGSVAYCDDSIGVNADNASWNP